MSRYFIIVLLAILGSTANALPLPKGPRALVQIPSTFTTDYNFEAIVALDNCSGSLIRFESSKDTDNALVLTNGHCYEGGFPAPGTFLYHEPSSRSIDLMDSGAQVMTTLEAIEVVYSTLTKTDITIYKLQESYESIQKSYGINALTLSSKHPEIGQQIEVISGYWSRGYTCAIEAFAFQLREGDYTWEDSIRYSRPGCEVIGGTSGSPVLAAGTRTVVGINNTGNENGQKCTDNNPCEVDKDGNISYQKGYSYAEETYLIYSCLNANNELDLSVEGCQLFH